MAKIERTTNGAATKKTFKDKDTKPRIYLGTLVTFWCVYPLL